MKSVRRTAIFLVCVTALASIGCATFQTPKVLEPGEVALGAGGIILLSDEGGMPNAAIFARLGILKNVDIGFKAELPLSTSFVLDVKYQIMQRPILIAADLGFFSFGETIGVVPSLLFGTERLYGGFKAYTRFNEYSPSSLVSKTAVSVYPTAVVGVAVGKRIKLLPEIAFSPVEWSSADVVPPRWSFFPQSAVGLGVQIKWDLR